MPKPADEDNVLLVEVTRKGLVESSHLTNHHSQVVGEIRPVFVLTRFDPPQRLLEAR